MSEETKPQGEEQPKQDQLAATPAETAATPEAKSDLPEVGYQVEDAGKLKKKVTVTVPRPRIDAKFDEMFGELAHTALVPGFRIGHAPRRLIEKRFGKDVSADVLNAVLGDALGQVVEKTKLQSVGELKLDMEKIKLPETGDLSFDFETEIMPEFELPVLKGIKVQKPKLEADEARVQEYIEQFRLSRATFEVTEDAAAEGDLITAGAKITGEGVEEVDRPGLSLRVAPGQIEGLPLVDLGKALSGKKAGETASLSVKVPAAHPTESWRDKELKVEIAISQVRRRHLPEINEEFATGAGFTSLAEFRQYIAQRLQFRLNIETQRSLRDQICKHLLDGATFELPDAAVEQQTAKVLQRRYIDLLQQGVPKEQIEEHITELQAAADEQARQSLKLTFILGKVAELEKITVDAGEVNSRIANMANASGRRPERVRQELEQQGALDEVQNALLEEKTLDKLLEAAEVTEVAAAEATEKPAPEKSAE